MNSSTNGNSMMNAHTTVGTSMPKFTISFARATLSSMSDPSTPRSPSSTRSSTASATSARSSPDDTSGACAALHHHMSGEWLDRQREAVSMHRRERHAAFVARHEAAVTEAVPISARLTILLAEGHRHELQRARAGIAPSAAAALDHPAVRVQRAAHVRTAYANLLEDVQRRCAVIASHNPTPQQLHALGSEAIGCFSSMLPWSEGIIGMEAEPPAVTSLQSPASLGSMPLIAEDGTAAPATVIEPLPATSGADCTSRRSRRGRRPSGLPPMKTQRSSTGPAVANAGPAAYSVVFASPTSPASHRSAAPTAPAQPPSVKWTVPARLAVDSRKLAAVTAARRERLATLGSTLSHGNRARHESPKGCAPVSSAKA